MNKNHLSNFAAKIALGLEEGIQFASGTTQLKRQNTLWLNLSMSRLTTEKLSVLDERN